MFGDIPAYGFFVRHVLGLQMHHINVQYLKDDQRPAFIFDDVKGADLQSIKAKKNGGIPTLLLKNVEDFYIGSSWPVNDTYIDRAVSKQF